VEVRKALEVQLSTIAKATYSKKGRYQINETCTDCHRSKVVYFLSIFRFSKVFERRGRSWYMYDKLKSLFAPKKGVIRAQLEDWRWACISLLLKSCNGYSLFWDVTPVLRICDPLSCIFFISFLLLNFMEWFTPDVWPVELWSPACGRWIWFGLLLYLVSMQDFNARLWAWEMVSFQGKFCLFHSRT